MITKLQQELIRETDLADIPEQYRDIAGITGVDTYVKLADYVRGDELYFPKVESILTPARNRRICREYNGYNQKELSEKYGLTIQQVSRVLKKAAAQQQAPGNKPDKPVPAKKMATLPGQMDLFGYLGK